jgi:hypothetical protein
MTPKKLHALMNNPADAPLYPYPPDYTNSETALNYSAPTALDFPLGNSIRKYQVWFSHAAAPYVPKVKLLYRSLRK